MSATEEIKPNINELAAPKPPDACSCEVLNGCSIPVDLLLLSSDGKIIGTHRQNLRVFAERFPIALVSHNSVFKLPETATILLLSLAFTHNSKTPDISSLNIDQLILLAETAQKYGNQFALMACRRVFPRTAPKSSQDALKIVKFKAKISDLDNDLDDIVRQTMKIPIMDAIKVFGQEKNGFCVWVQYQQTWLNNMEKFRVADAGHRQKKYKVHPSDYQGRSDIACKYLSSVVGALEPVLKVLEIKSLDSKRH
ncbi:hypothetical protein V5O48_012142 [Marasmius crinis-equi]